jgi:hypothetical protein
VNLVAQMIPCLLGGSPVVGQAVGLDDQSQVRPKEVDPESVEALLRERHRQTHFGDQAEE